MRTVDIKTFEHKGYTGVIAHQRLNDEIKEAHPDVGILCDWFCGYVVIPETHPLHRVEYDDTYNSNMDIEVHGGLTYSGDHILKSREWCLGFDCNHFMDTPDVQDEAYTKNEVIKMIEQLITFEAKEFEKND